MRMSILWFPLLAILAAGVMSIGAQAGPDELPAPPPDGATVLFDGKDLSHWVYKKDGSPAEWKLIQGAMEVHGGDIVTKEKYKDFKLHVEFWLPNLPEPVK